MRNDKEDNTLLPATTPRRAARPAFFLAAAVVVPAAIFLMLSAPAGDPAVPAPLPPPPELLGETAGPLPELPANPEETRRALEPPAAIAPAPIEPAPAVVYGGSVAAAPMTVPAPRTVATIRAPLSDMTVSPPSRHMPEDYFNLPLEDEAVPGVVLPEIDRAYYARMGGAAAPARRQAAPGMSVRQLEPYFALAKGSEAMALESSQKGDEQVYREQLGKALDAYMAIIAMADASTEAREEAWYGVARCEYRRGNWWQAFDALERSFPKKFEKGEVAGRIKLEMYIGERLWRMGNDPVAGANPDGAPLTGYQAASRVYAAAIFNQPTAQDAPLALLRRGDAAALEKDWKEAAKFYRQVIEYYPESEQAMQARSSLTESIYRQDWPAGFPEAARSDVALIMDDVERADSRLSDDALERRKRAVTVANDLEAETKLRQAKGYLKSIRVRKSRDAAVFLLGDIVSFYPNTPQAGEAADLLRRLGVQPPATLADGTRFPLTAGGSGAGAAPGQEIDFGIGGGSVRVEGQSDRGGGALAPSPTRETVYGGFPESVPGNGAP